MCSGAHLARAGLFLARYLGRLGFYVHHSRLYIIHDLCMQAAKHPLGSLVGSWPLVVRGRKELRDE